MKYIISNTFISSSKQQNNIKILECGLHDVFFSVNNFLHNMADTVERTLGDFAKLLKTIFEEDDDPKGISSDNKSNLDSWLEI